jgi:predicted dehydrogenase
VQEDYNIFFSSTKLEDLLGKVDIVTVAKPRASHMTSAVLLLENGIHV